MKYSSSSNWLSAPTLNWPTILIIVFLFWLLSNQLNRSFNGWNLKILLVFLLVSSIWTSTFSKLKALVLGTFKSLISTWASCF